MFVLCFSGLLFRSLCRFDFRQAGSPVRHLRGSSRGTPGGPGQAAGAAPAECVIFLYPGFVEFREMTRSQ
jgi:hypothetical protein